MRGRAASWIARRFELRFHARFSLGNPPFKGVHSQVDAVGKGLELTGIANVDSRIEITHRNLREHAGDEPTK